MIWFEKENKFITVLVRIPKYNCVLPSSCCLYYLFRIAYTTSEVKLLKENIIVL